MSRLLHIISSAKLWSEEIGKGLNKRVDYLQNLATCNQSHDFFFHSRGSQQVFLTCHDRLILGT